MEHKIIVDSCCDMTPQLAEKLGITIVPLTMRLGEKEFTDDDSLDLPGFMAEMEAGTDRISTAAPSPVSFKEAIESAKNSFIITISKHLSATFENATLGKALAEESGDVDTHVFDSKTASAGEVLLAIKLREMLNLGKSKEQIIKSFGELIDTMKTFFVLERYDNLIKNGRLNKVAGKIVGVLNIKLIMGADGNGQIALFAKPRGTKRMIAKILDLIGEKWNSAAGETMVISHCNNPDLVKQITDAVKSKFNFKDIVVVPTSGTISVYSDNKGIIMAF